MLLPHWMCFVCLYVCEVRLRQQYGHFVKWFKNKEKKEKKSFMQMVKRYGVAQVVHNIKVERFWNTSVPEGYIMPASACR